MFSDCSSGIHVGFMSFLKRLYACGSSRVSFAILCLGTCLSLLNWLKEWRNCILELIKCPFQRSDDSAGRAQYYVESYVYEPEDGENAPGLGSNSEVTTGEASTAQLPVIVSGCFITTSGKCLHTAVCHHGKRAEVKTLAVKICTKCLSNDIKRFPHTSEVYVDWNDCVHQSRVCEDFHRRYSHLSDIAVKRIVKKCRHCF